MESIPKNNKAKVATKTKKQPVTLPYESLEAALTDKHQKANDFIKKVKLSF